MQVLNIDRLQLLPPSVFQTASVLAVLNDLHVHGQPVGEPAHQLAAFVVLVLPLSDAVLSVFTATLGHAFVFGIVAVLLNFALMLPLSRL